VPGETSCVDEHPQKPEPARDPGQQCRCRTQQSIAPAYSSAIEALDAQPPCAHPQRLPVANPEAGEEQHAGAEQQTSVGRIAGRDRNAVREEEQRRGDEHDDRHEEKRVVQDGSESAQQTGRARLPQFPSVLRRFRATVRKAYRDSRSEPRSEVPPPPPPELGPGGGGGGGGGGTDAAQAAIVAGALASAASAVKSCRVQSVPPVSPAVPIAS